MSRLYRLIEMIANSRKKTIEKQYLIVTAKSLLLVVGVSANTRTLRAGASGATTKDTEWVPTEYSP